MKTREEALSYGLSFPDTYQEAPFHDDNWQLIRVKGSKKAFLWVYEKDGIIQLNVKANPEWRDYWRDTHSPHTTVMNMVMSISGRVLPSTKSMFIKMR